MLYYGERYHCKINYRDTHNMTRVTAAMLLAGLFLFGCAQKPDAEEKVLAELLKKDFYLSDTILSYGTSRADWPGSHYWGGVVHIGKQSFLMSGDVNNPSLRWVKYLGEDVIVIKLAPYAGRLELCYVTKQNEEEQYCSVPFGDIFGNIPAEKLPHDKNPSPASSPRYGVAGFTVLQEQTIESLIPRLKKYLTDDDAAAIADMICFPIMAWPEGNKPACVIENATEFISKYQLIFPPERKQILLNLADDDFFCNVHGLCVGRGELWLFPGDNDKIYIYRL